MGVYSRVRGLAVYSMPASWIGCLSALCVCLVCLLFIRVGSVSSEYLNTEPAGVPLIMDSYSM